MGSLGSSPSVPRTQTIYVPASVPPSTAAVTPDTGANASDGNNSNQSQSPEQSASETRSKSLLARDRGRFGTITTGFRGLLGLGNTQRQQKTLLGE